MPADAGMSVPQRLPHECRRQGPQSVERAQGMQPAERPRAFPELFFQQRPSGAVGVCPHGEPLGAVAVKEAR